MSDGSVLQGTLFSAGAIVIMDRAVSLINNLRNMRQATLPKEQLDERCRVHDEEMARLEKRIETVDTDRARDVRQVCDMIRETNQSVSTALNDVARAMGRLEGGQEVARAIKEGFEQLSKKSGSS